MNPNPQTSVIERLVRSFTGFLAGGRFAAFGLFTLAFYTVFIAVMAFAPPAGSEWGRFVEQFRTRCFGLDPATGLMNRADIWIMLTEPIPLAAIFFFLSRRQLRELWTEHRPALLPLAGSALMLVAVIAVSLLGVGRTNAVATPAELPFPADRLRSALPVPPFELTNQDGATIRLADFRGKVVLMTAVYSTCVKTCPMMLNKIRAVLADLPAVDREQLAVIAFSLSPETDTRELRAATTRIYGMTSPQFHFVNGVPEQVNAVLDQLTVARQKSEANGEIMHSNLFFLIDREGRIAYRLSFSERESSWLTDALRVLLAEPAS